MMGGADRRALELIGEVVTELTSLGWSVEWVEYAEDSRTPGLLGQIKGVTDWDAQTVKLAVRPHESLADLAVTARHELRHVREPEWDCGNRDVLGRGGPRGRTATDP